MEESKFMDGEWGTVLHSGLMIRSCQGREIFINAFSSNLKTVNLKLFSSHEGICTCKDKALTSVMNHERIYS